jgi:hypothetical protein
VVHVDDEVMDEPGIVAMTVPDANEISVYPVNVNTALVLIEYTAISAYLLTVTR